MSEKCECGHTQDDHNNDPEETYCLAPHCYDCTSFSPAPTQAAGTKDELIDAAKSLIERRGWSDYKEYAKGEAAVLMADFASEQTAPLLARIAELEAELANFTEREQLDDHVRRNNITGHSINADGSCNMGCC